jgi:hypothetical protein
LTRTRVGRFLEMPEIVVAEFHGSAVNWTLGGGSSSPPCRRPWGTLRSGSQKDRPLDKTGLGGWGDVTALHSGHMADTHRRTFSFDS